MGITVEPPRDDSTRPTIGVRVGTAPVVEICSVTVNEPGGIGKLRTIESRYRLGVPGDTAVQQVRDSTSIQDGNVSEDVIRADTKGRSIP